MIEKIGFGRATARGTQLNGAVLPKNLGRLDGYLTLPMTFYRFGFSRLTSRLLLTRQRLTHCSARQLYGQPSHRYCESHSSWSTFGWSSPTRSKSRAWRHIAAGQTRVSDGSSAFCRWGWDAARNVSAKANLDGIVFGYKGSGVCDVREQLH